MAETYTVQDTETGKTVTFQWDEKDPPTDDDMVEIFAEARKQEPSPGKQFEPFEAFKTEREATETLQDIGQVYPALETGAHLATSAYGMPLSGLAGLFAVPFVGMDKAGGVVQAVQDALIYKPQTPRGEHLTGAVTYPVQKLDELAGTVGSKLEEAGHPELAAAAHTAIVGGPVIAAGGRMALRPGPRAAITKIDAKMKQAIDRGINKAVRPSVIKKETYTQIQKYRNKSRTAVQEIIKNKDNLNILDQNGARIEGLPKTLDQFSQAIDQTKRTIFEQYDTLADIAGKKGVKIDLPAIADKLESAIQSKSLRDFSPETIKFAEGRMAVLKERGTYTALETQEAIQLLNQTLEKFYRDPSPQMKGQAFVDSSIANNLRVALDAAIERTTGREYQILKNRYGALRMLEKDVTKRSIVDARKNVKGLIDFSDVYTGYHIVRGMLAKDPASTVAGVGGKMIAHYMKLRNNPNRIVKAMFEDVEKLTQQRLNQQLRIKP